MNNHMYFLILKELYLFLKMNSIIFNNNFYA